MAETPYSSHVAEWEAETHLGPLVIDPGSEVGSSLKVEGGSTVQGDPEDAGSFGIHCQDPHFQLFGVKWSRR